ncbi:MAG: hypothetical protein Ct9H90mP22_8010 [Gammaproteobacteria bacterium]|nr:MAG: hypothetical protein Ct9H90mP22_8010 [Gammaproteobacteria bacterium]
MSRKSNVSLAVSTVDPIGTCKIEQAKNSLIKIKRVKLLLKFFSH